jgi:hypothetical protein
MENQDSQKSKPGFDSKKQPYEAPKVTFVRVELEERVLGCVFSTIKYCGLTE